MTTDEKRRLIRLLEYIVQEIDESPDDSLSDIVNNGLELINLIPNRMNSDLRFF